MSKKTLQILRLPQLLVERRSSALFGVGLIAMLWAGILLKYIQDRNDDLVDAYRTAHSFSMVFEENVVRSIDELDTMLLYLRREIEDNGPSPDYNKILHRMEIPPDILVQAGIIDSSGMMRASTVGPQPAPEIDLHDREHFRAQIHSTADQLFISRPVIGRASGEWSIQLSRRFTHAEKFGGVVVASLDPDHFTKFYTRIDLPFSESIALIGEDGFVRAAGGMASYLKMGEDIRGTALYIAMRQGVNITFELRDAQTGEPRIIGLRKANNRPLWVMVSLNKNEVLADSFRGLGIAAIGGLVLTLFILAAMEFTFHTEEEAQQKSKQLETTSRAMARLASEDALTSLLNRRGFQTALERATRTQQERQDLDYAVLFLDLDRFKIINDTLGHRVGDLLLKGVGERLRGSLGPHDVLARLGGDEFAVMAVGYAGTAGVASLASRLSGAIREPFSLADHRVQTSISIGIALAPADGKTSDDLLAAADLALYATKESGPNGYQFYRPSMTAEMSVRREIEADLRDAMDRDELQLYYQPIVSLRDQKVRGFEALARWRHAERGFVPPSVFIPIAEDTGLMARLGEWALNTACRQAAALPADIRIAVNLSPAQFSTGDLARTVERALEASGLDPHRLELEITERLLLESSAPTLSILEKLNQLGVSIALDDFGSGYSSLSYLRKFSLDKVKIDRSFIIDLDNQSEQIAIIRGVVSIVRALGMTLTAEGVETESQSEILRALGCEYAQGYLFGEPIPFEEIGRTSSEGRLHTATAA
jgi:diguanylate cyclase (GGDEF)-like protein